MLETIIDLKNIGVFQDCTPRTLTLQKATLIYADNARGKSTLAAVFQACSMGDNGMVSARATLGATAAPKVMLRFLFGSKGSNLIFENGAWNGKEPRLVVFDQNFVEKNVYAASEVGAEQHQALLDFALGPEAVAKRRETDGHAEAQVAATKRRTAAENTLSGYRDGMPLADFLNLEADPEADKNLEALMQRIANTRQNAQIAARPTPRALTIPTADFDRFTSVLLKALENIHEGAKAIVAKHLEKIGPRGERWLGEGHKLMDGSNCPFCGQNTQGLELIEAYRTHFNDAYAQHMAAVTGLDAAAQGTLSEGAVSSLLSAHQNNVERIAGWEPQLRLKIPTLDSERLARLATEITNIMLQAAQAKARTPLEAVVKPELSAARSKFQEVIDILTASNGEVEAVNAEIATFKHSLAAENMTALEQSLRIARLRKARQSQEVITLVGDRAQADADRAASEKAKSDAKTAFENLTDATLTEYQSAINTWLGRFGAPFLIGQLQPNYVGGAKTQYCIILRGVTVSAGKKSATGPCFQNCLSEGDKRTLAFALFLARLLSDPGVAEKIVILDDVFNSLDKDRKNKTIEAITLIGQSCAQILVLGHDAYFLREVSKKIRDKNLGNPLALQLRRAANDFSELDGIDLEDKCASLYYQRYSELNQFLAGEHVANKLAVAVGLRPLIEGYLHRRFPGYIKEDVRFGMVLEDIKNATSTNPLTILKSQLEEFRSLNEYASAYHHDTSGRVPQRNDVNDRELQTYGETVMRLIHTGSVLET